jgi:hypothetical protein
MYSVYVPPGGGGSDLLQLDKKLQPNSGLYLNAHSTSGSFFRHVFQPRIQQFVLSILFLFIFK